MAKPKYLGVFYTFIFSSLQGFGIIYLFFSLFDMSFFSVYEKKTFIEFIDYGVLICLFFAFLIGKGIGKSRNSFSSIYLSLITTTVFSMSISLFLEASTNYELAVDEIIAMKVYLGGILLFISIIASILPTLLTTYLTQKLLKYHLD